MYRLKANYKITPEQDRAVNQIVENYQNNKKRQVLLGVTGSGKTFAMANIIDRLDVSCLILSPNKTLAAQLYQEFKDFFPGSKVGYFISYYDYYQPEAYVPQRHLYISKEVSINSEIERLRIEATRGLLEAERAIIVASVSSIYSIGSPDDFFQQKMTCSLLSEMDWATLLKEFISLGYTRTEGLMESGKFRVRGDIVEIFPTSEENPIRFVLDEEEIAAIEIFDPVTAVPLQSLDTVNIYPVSYFHLKKERVQGILPVIEAELKQRIAYFRGQGEEEYAERIKERTLFDLEMLGQYGYCAGIENYSFYLTKRRKGDPPYTLLDFFKGDFLTIMDESHIAVPQLVGMYRGDRSRKTTLVNFGFRLPSALENRPLNFAEINRKLKKVLYVSATPNDYEIKDAQENVTSLLVRPTGLLDPEIELRKTAAPVEDMVREIEKELRDNRGRVLITTLTKKMAEKLTAYIAEKGIACTYMHSEIKTLDRVKIIKKLRVGEVKVLVGINLLREGLDLPEVSLVVILDADREGFLRSETSLIQTFGRASRNLKGRVILYLQKETESIAKAVGETNRRREYQERYNQEHNITPASIDKQVKDFYDDDYWIKKSEEVITANFKSRESVEKEIEKLTAKMKEKAESLEFKAAAALREKIKSLKNLMLELY
ncbi:MAG: excinuclease ABC subunit UvrB [Candidatus Aminicenantes bacterium]|nr:excinuclease ABC subunit UvrB [Candidatus Aminicenantes bacterium]